MTSRTEFEALAAPEVNKVLRPDEMIVASGRAAIHPGKHGFALGNISKITKIQFYWVTLTSRQLILIRTRMDGQDPKLEAALPLSDLKLLRSKKGFASVALWLSIDPDHPLMFTADEKRTGRQILDALEVNQGSA